MTRAKLERKVEGFLERPADRCRILREHLVAAELAMAALRQSLTPDLGQTGSAAIGQTQTQHDDLIVTDYQAALTSRAGRW